MADNELGAILCMISMLLLIVVVVIHNANLETSISDGEAELIFEEDGMDIEAILLE